MPAAVLQHRGLFRNFAAMKFSFAELSEHYKMTLKLGLPIAVGQLGVIILGFADTMMVGRYSTEALAAASFVNNLFTLITFLLMGYSYGITPLVSAHVGRGERHEAAAVLKNALGANALFAALLLSAMTALYFCLHLLGQPEELLPLVRPYYVVILVSMLFVMLFNVLRQFTDGTGDTQSGMWALLAGNALNILGNWLLIGGVGPFPELGLPGAGVSTLVSRIVMFVLLLAVVMGRGRYADFRHGFARSLLRRAEVARINRQSLPVSIQMGLETGSFTFSAIMAGWIGAIELASFQILVTIGTLGFLFYYSFGAGMSIRVATFVGTQEWRRVRLASRAGTHILLVMAALSSLMIWVFARPLISFFTPDALVIATSLSLVAPLVLYQFGDAMQICYANALRGTAHVLPMMWVAFVSYVLVGIPAGYVLGFVAGLGIHGIFLAFSLGLFTAAALFFWQYHRVVGRHEV